MSSGSGGRDEFPGVQMPFSSNGLDCDVGAVRGNGLAKGDDAAECAKPFQGDVEFPRIGTGENRVDGPAHFLGFRRIGDTCHHSRDLGRILSQMIMAANGFWALPYSVSESVNSPQRTGQRDAGGFRPHFGDRF